MIVEENNPFKEDEIKNRKIFEMLNDVKLPKHYVFVDDCIQIRYRILGGFIDEKIAEIDLDADIVDVCFVDEEDLEKLRKYFINSKTKFRLRVDEAY